MINSVVILLVLVLCLTTSTPSPLAKTTNKKPNSSLSLQLLHRSSIFKNENFQDFLHKQDVIFTTAPLFQAARHYVYFVNLTVGDPPVPQFMAVDTGSSIVWVDGYSRNKRYYYRRPHSSTYKSVNCSTPECSLNQRFRCSPLYSDNCLFLLYYGNNRNVAAGYLGFERFGFPDGFLDKVLFGVATNTRGIMFGDVNFHGILLGLGPQPSSLLVQNLNEKKLSYCMADIFNGGSQSSFLRLGFIDDFDDESMYVPLIHDEYYTVDMDCIEFRETCLGGFNQSILKYDGRDPLSGVIFDTGAVYTFLADEAYDALADTVAGFMRSKGFVEPLNQDTQLCYKGQREQVSDFPLVSFHFVDKNVNADLSLRLESGSLFYNEDSTFCMTVIKSSSKSILYKYTTFIGLAAQQNHTILFDLEASRMSIQHTSCRY